MLDSMSSCFITSTNLKYQPLFIYLLLFIYYVFDSWIYLESQMLMQLFNKFFLALAALTVLRSTPSAKPEKTKTKNSFYFGDLKKMKMLKNLCHVNSITSPVIS